MKIIMNDHRYIGCVDIKTYGLHMSYMLESISKQIMLTSSDVQLSNNLFLP